MTQGGAAIEFQGVCKRYATGQANAVDHVDLRAREGEIVALVGESGSGKTTLLRLAAGLEVPDAGVVRITGDIVASDVVWIPPERRRVGLVFQDGALFPHLTAHQNICYGIPGKSEEEQTKVVHFMLAMVGLPGKAERFPHQLSGGERQRLALARALAPQPNVILLDEPFSNLDPGLRRSLREEVRLILNKLKATSILVTHDTEDAMAVGDRMVIFRDGHIEQEGEAREVYQRPANGYCAQLFGPANRILSPGNGEKWIRPEHLKLVKAGKDRGIPVRVEQIREVGRHREVLVRPKEVRRSKPGDLWTVYVEYDTPYKVGGEAELVPREGRSLAEG
ncbi:MAG: ABC transporter ATP-binding protein [Verrucomicrobiota bacterium]